MKNKFKSAVIACVLAVFGVFAGLGLSGCGGSLSTLESNYKSMNDTIEKYDTVFVSDNVDVIGTKLKVVYGEKAQQAMNGDADSEIYKDDLNNKYNSLLVVSHDYVDDNIQVLLNMNQKKLSKATKKAVKQLCKDMKSFTKYISTFATSLNSFNSYFEQMTDANHSDVEHHVFELEKVFGKLVEKDINMALSLAKCMEKSNIYNSLKVEGIASSETAKNIRDYARTKMLPIFSEFMISQKNGFIWKNYVTKGKMTEINALLTELGTCYGNFKSNLVSGGTPAPQASAKDLFSMVEEFIDEANCYLDALSDLDIKTLAVTYNGDMAKHLKKNKLAEIDLHKIDQFIKITLPNFITNFKAKVGC